MRELASRRASKPVGRGLAGEHGHVRRQQRVQVAQRARARRRGSPPGRGRARRGPCARRPSAAPRGAAPWRARPRACSLHGAGPGLTGPATEVRAVGASADADPSWRCTAVPSGASGRFDVHYYNRAYHLIENTGDEKMLQLIIRRSGDNLLVNRQYAEAEPYFRQWWAGAEKGRSLDASERLALSLVGQGKMVRPTRSSAPCGGAYRAINDWRGLPGSCKTARAVSSTMSPSKRFRKLHLIASSPGQRILELEAKNSSFSATKSYPLAFFLPRS